MLLFAAALAWPIAARGAEHRTQVVVEVGEGSADQVDVQLVRRLVRLELLEIAVPPPHEAPSTTPPPLYVRIVPHGTHLNVELWDHGLLQGERRVSVRGGSSLTARSIALVAAELAKRLADRRRRQARAAQLKEERGRRRSLEQRGYPIFARLALDAAAQGARVGKDTWLVGPALRGELRFDRSWHIGLRGRGLVGFMTKPELELQWLEFGVAPGYEFELGKRSTLVVGADIGAASTSFASVDRVDDSSSTATWNGKAALTLDYIFRVGSHYEAQLGIEGGSTLRTVQLERRDAAESMDARFGGLWLGVRVGVGLDPN